MHHCFATAESSENGLEFQIVPGESGCIMLLCMALRDLLEK
jgi:hypothetical protein